MLPNLRKVFDSIWTLDVVCSLVTKAYSFDGSSFNLKGCVLKNNDIEDMMLSV